MGNLDFEDVQNVARRLLPWPSSDGLPGWVIAGGGAVKFLLASTHTSGYTLDQPGFISSGRTHKDLDLVVFKPELCRKPLSLRHEIFQTICGGPFRRCAYHRAEPDYSGFFVEVLHHWYFGFPPPLQGDVALTTTEDGPLWTLSPEYIVASRLFDVRGIRHGEDDEDVRRLRAKYRLDYETIFSIVQRGSFAFLEKSAVFYVIENDAEVDLRDSIAQALMRRLPEGAAAVIPNHPALHRALLLFPSGTFEMERLMHAFAVADKIVAIKFTVKLAQEHALVCALALVLYHSTFSYLPPRIRTLIAEKMVPHCADTLIPCLLQFSHSALQLKQVFYQHGWIRTWSTLFDGLFPFFFKTDFKNVVIAELYAFAEELQTLDAEQARLRLHSFMQFLGWKKWPFDIGELS